MGRLGLMKPGPPPKKHSPICIFLGDTFKIVVDSAKKKIQTFLYSAKLWGVLWTPSYINLPWCEYYSFTFTSVISS